MENCLQCRISLISQVSGIIRIYGKRLDLQNRISRIPGRNWSEYAVRLKTVTVALVPWPAMKSMWIFCMDISLSDTLDRRKCSSWSVTVPGHRFHRQKRRQMISEFCFLRDIWVRVHRHSIRKVRMKWEMARQSWCCRAPGFRMKWQKLQNLMIPGDFFHGLQ